MAIELDDKILIALRRIVRAIDLHSRHLAQKYGLTSPQIIVLRELQRHGRLHASDLARNVSLSHATVTDILNRLERRGLVCRARSEVDRRRILVTPTEEASALMATSPPLLQEQFLEQLARLQDWELTQILSVLQRIALMMDAKQVDASPLLATGAATADHEMVEKVTSPDDQHGSAANMKAPEPVLRTGRRSNKSTAA